MKFLIDNNLPPNLARALDCLSQNQGLGVSKVVALRDLFPQATPDIEWLTALAQEGGWCVISGDAFKKSPAEKELIRRAGFVVFVLQKQWASHRYWEKSAQLVTWWPRIVGQAGMVTKTALVVPWRIHSRFEQISL